MTRERLPATEAAVAAELRAATDTEIEIRKDAITGIATATVTKQKDGEDGDEFAFELQQVRLGEDEDGEPITSCIVIPAEVAARPASAPTKLSAPCAVVLSALRQAVAEAGEVPPACNQIPANVRTVHVDLWRKFAYAKNISDGEPNARRMAFKRASAQLQARGLIGCWQDQVWPLGAAE